MGFAQSVQFSKDSIPVIDGEVAFRVKFEYELDKGAFFRRAFSYLNDKLNPYSGAFLINNSTFASIGYQTLCTNNEIFSCFAGTHPAQPCVKKEKLFERKRVLFF